MEIKNVWYGDVVIAYKCPIEMQTFVLSFTDVLLVPGLDANLLCVDQMQEHGCVVNDVPLVRLRADQRTYTSHCIMADGCRIPLHFDKPISYFMSRRPIDDKTCNPVNYRWVTLTSNSQWYPYNEDTRLAEERLRMQIDSDYQPP